MNLLANEFLQILQGKIFHNSSWLSLLFGWPLKGFYNRP